MYYHKTWKQIAPLDKETFYNDIDEYIIRISSIQWTNNIPKLVFDQWILHLYKHELTKNYSWIDLSKVKFEVEIWDTDKLLNINFLRDDYIEDLTTMSTDEIKKYTRNSDRAYWEKNGTWKIPPIIANTLSFGNIPPNVEFHSPLQLIEGHTRIGLLKRYYKSELKINKEHSIYLMTNSQQ